MKIISEFYEDLNNYPRNRKWMIFDFYVRQPFGLVKSIIQSVLYLIMSLIYRTDILLTTGALVVAFIEVGLFFGTLVRKKYSLLCLMVLWVMQAVSIIMSEYNSVLGFIAAAACLTLVIIYYYKRKNFFYKEAIASDGGELL